MKKIASVLAVVSLALISQAQAQLDFHYNWLDQTEIDTCFWTLAEGWAPETGVASGSPGNEHGGRLRLVNNPGAWTHISSVERVVRPHPTTGTVEMIADFWGPSDGLASFTAVYAAAVPRPGRPAEFLDVSHAIGMTWRGMRNDTQPGWTMCANANCTFQPPGLYSSIRPVRIRYSSTQADGVELDYRLLNEVTGQFVGGWNPGAVRPDPPDTAIDDPLAFLDLNPPPTDPPTDRDPPYHWNFSVLGNCSWGMIEVYQSTGNDGTIPAPGNGNDARPGVLPQNGFQVPRGRCNLPGGLCDDLTAVDCAAGGGSYQGDGTSCPTGACELTGGGDCGAGCRLLTSGKCNAKGGTYTGDGSACGVGACELPSGTCSLLESADCDFRGGNYLGNGSSCPTVTPILDYHYNWIGQGAGGGINPADWAIGPGQIAGVTPLGRFSLTFETEPAPHPAGAWRSFSSVERVVRPHPGTGAVEMIVDLWSKDGHHNWHAQYPGIDHSTTGAFSNNAMALAMTHVGTTPGPGGPGWSLCVNGANCLQVPNSYDGTVPVRIRMSAAQGTALVNLDARLLDADTGLFVGDWFPAPATTHGFGLDLTLLSPQDPPFKFGFSQTGRVEYGMVEVYQNLGNNGSLPAPGNINGNPPSPLPCNGFQDNCNPTGDNTNLAGDCNQDGAVDLSDVICLLGFLFQNNPPTLPCTGDAANRSLMDCNGDGSIDLSDAIYKLAYLFQGDTAPVQGVNCFVIAGCPQNTNGCGP